MHWIRVDRYYAGAVANPRTVFQPVPCMQCEHAPCEVVCPVEASVHDAQGINVQVYNRCVGTRFCSNNCPYKVRRFNFLQYSDDAPGLDAQRNPEVTVRMRGVMEKCNYCLQRITTAKIAADREGRALRDGEVVTACQAVCPTRAIVFGDLALPDSAVNRRKRSPLDYALLAELNTRPRTTYLARVTNPAAGIDDQPMHLGDESAKSRPGPSPAHGGNAIDEGRPMAADAGTLVPPPGERYTGAIITDKIADLVLVRPLHWGYYVGFAISGMLTLLLLVAISYLFAKGVGIWGINQPVAWAFALTNFVWWVGIGHAGTFISAFLLLLRQHWRTSINRFAEAMTIFAVAMAGLMPILHLGRPWFFYWLIPYPNVMNVWPQWRSPLVWDIFAIGTYIIVSILFWYMGLHSRSRIAARPRAHARQAGRLRPVRARLARRGAPLAAASRRRTC